LCGSNPTGEGKNPQGARVKILYENKECPIGLLLQSLMLEPNKRLLNFEKISKTKELEQIKFEE